MELVLVSRRLHNARYWTMQPLVLLTIIGHLRAVRTFLSLLFWYTETLWGSFIAKYVNHQLNLSAHLHVIVSKWIIVVVYKWKLMLLIRFGVQRVEAHVPCAQLFPVISLTLYPVTYQSLWVQLPPFHCPFKDPSIFYISAYPQTRSRTHRNWRVYTHDAAWLSRISKGWPMAKSRMSYLLEKQANQFSLLGKNINSNWITFKLSVFYSHAGSHSRASKLQEKDE